MNSFLQKIHHENIYENFESLLPYGSEKSNIHQCLSFVADELSKDKKEIVTIELGSWKGQSAIETVSAFLDRNVIPTLFAVDCFTGSVFHRENLEFFSMLKCKNGFPQLYQQFISNIIHSKTENFIVPVPHTTVDAYRYLSNLEIRADFIYLDANHRFEEVLFEIQNYWNLLNFGGIMALDDVNPGFPEVGQAAEEFIKNNSVPRTEKMESQLLLFK